MEGKIANPAPLGLFGFGMTTVLLNLHNAGLINLGTMIMAMGIFYGGLAQIIAGLMDFRKGNTFGALAFSSYGLFWETLVFLILMNKWGWWNPQDSLGIVFYLLMWGIFTFLLWIVLFKTKHGADIQFVFITLWILFFLLALGDFTGSSLIKLIAGWEGIVCGASAMYVGFKTVLSESQVSE